MIQNGEKSLSIHIGKLATKFWLMTPPWQTTWRESGHLHISSTVSAVPGDVQIHFETSLSTSHRRKHLCPLMGSSSTEFDPSLDSARCRVLQCLQVRQPCLRCGGDEQTKPKGFLAGGASLCVFVGCAGRSGGWLFGMPVFGIFFIYLKLM